MNSHLADFANKYVGGGVLGNGSLQEEIRFVVSPEMLGIQLNLEFCISHLIIR
jgi:hypothetical protein